MSSGGPDEDLARQLVPAERASLLAAQRALGDVLGGLLEECEARDDLIALARGELLVPAAEVLLRQDSLAEDGLPFLLRDQGVEPKVGM